MKKRNLISTAVFTTAIVVMTACGGGFSAKKVTLTTENDSINYTLGLANGAQIKQVYLAVDTNKNAIADFVKNVDKAFAATKGKDDVYMQGYQLGQWLKLQQKNGLLDNPNYKLNTDLMKQGFINSFRKYNDKDGLTAGSAQGYVQRIFNKIQQEKMQQQQLQQQMQQPQPAPDDTAVSHEGHNH
ncbi:MAG: hypothetical protein LBB41_02880 [Prevotellaceae bacterium]|jgi:hypothetical protein|nr:hypothetical protein [Prevotellaceae bacterium]